MTGINFDQKKNDLIDQSNKQWHYYHFVGGQIEKVIIIFIQFGKKTSSFSMRFFSIVCKGRDKFFKNVK